EGQAAPRPLRPRQGPRRRLQRHGGRGQGPVGSQGTRAGRGDDLRPAGVGGIGILASRTRLEGKSEIRNSKSETNSNKTERSKSETEPPRIRGFRVTRIWNLFRI